MPIVGSGSLFLRGGVEDNKSIAFEVFGNITGSNISLRQLALEADMTASADDPMSEFYNFQSLAPPETVTTSAASSIGTTTATLNGSVTSTGGVTSRGFKYMSGNQSQATVEASGTETTAGSGDGSFSKGLSGLSINVTYTFVAWAENAAGRTYGTKTTFNTLPQYTYSVTQASFVGRTNTYYQSQLGPANRTGTAAQGGTATANFTNGSRIGYRYNHTAGNTVNAQGPYNAVNFQTGNNYGWTVQKSGMNANASMTLNTFFADAQENAYAIEPNADIFDNSNVSWIDMRYRAYYNQSAQVDGNVNTRWYLLNNPSNPTAFNTFQYLAGTPTLYGHGMPRTGPTGGGGYYQHQSFQVRPGQSWTAGEHTSYGNTAQNSYRYRGPANFHSLP